MVENFCRLVGVLIMIFRLCLLIFVNCFIAVSAISATADAVRIKDLGKLQGWRENALVGYGVVSGLAGTGDSPSNRTTRQALANILSQLNLTIPVDQIQSRNVAVVMVTAALPAFAREGDTLDLTVTSAGDARSLVGGALLLTPLKGPNGRIYALAQGALSVGGYRYDANGNVVQKNHPTVGSIPGGASVEVGVDNKVSENKKVTFVLQQPDYTTAVRIADAINGKFNSSVAIVKDAAGIEIQIPEPRREQLANFLAEIESVTVEPDRRAKVVINERTGTVVAGGDVRISKVVISHGDIKVSIQTENSVSQPIFLNRPNENIRTELVSNSRMDVNESSASGYVAPIHNTVADLVQSLLKIKMSTRDIISILRAIKTAGALHAELVIQ